MGGKPTGPSAYGPWRDTDLLIPSEVRDPVGPAVAAATMELNLPSVADFCWNWKNHITPGDRVAVVSDHAEDADRKCIFSGFIADSDWTFDTNQQVIVTAVGAPFRLLRDSKHVIFGRYMENKSGGIVCFTGLPCVFNANGRPNRSVSAFPIEGAPDEGIHVFTADNDHNAEYWSVTDALEYLMWFYNLSETWVINHLFSTADFEATLSSQPVTTDVEGNGLWAALAAVAEHGGYDLACRYTLSGEYIFSAIHLVRKGAGTEQVLDHQPPAADGSFDAFDSERTNLFAASVAEATASCVTEPIVAGARGLHEITIELISAWESSRLTLPSGSYIVSPGQEKANASSDYVKRYVVGGADFAEYSACGRLWDGNTDGFYIGPPWYELTIPDVAALAGKTAGSWPVMLYKPHRMVSKISAGPNAAGVEHYVEYTIDGGINWYPLGGNQCRVLGGSLGVYITAANLAEIYPDGGDKNTDNLFYKLWKTPASVKVRLTCCVASPHRGYCWSDRRSTAGTAFRQGEFFDRDALGIVRERAVSSRFSGTDVPADTADETTRLQTAAVGLLDINEDKVIEAGLTMEWIAPEINLGDRVTRIGGIEVDLKTGSGAAVRSPRVVCRTFRLTADTLQTELTLDTERKQPVL